jgi:uncharacterized protein (TIGR02466 family)
MPHAATSERLENHFPVQVLVRDHAGASALNHRLFDVIAGLRQRDAGSKRDAVAMRQCTTMGGFQTAGDSDFLDHADPAVRELRDAIVMPAVHRYLAQALQANPLLVDFKLHSWANVLRAGDWQAPHMHPTEFNVASGVYYVRVPEAPEPQGWLEFINPHPISTLHGDRSSRRHQPREGQLLIFPPYYMHFVHPFAAAGERAIVSFDVRLRPARGSA